MTLPTQAYQKQIEEGKVIYNPDQFKVMEIFDDIYKQLIERQQRNRKPFNQLLKKISKQKPIKGLYLWGSVGVGKTFLMDLFYECLPSNFKKMRMHFHEFMEMVHNQLKTLQGKKDPLTIIGGEIAKKTMVICFDEFFVSNVADAMLLGKLLKSIFNQGITLITSSNIPPDDLYKEGLNREQFLPAIALLKENTKIIYLHSSQDYRLRHLQQAGVYYTPLNESAKKQMNKIFDHFAEDHPISYDPIHLFQRQIDIIKQAKNVIWFDFFKICGIPRSQKDFLALAKEYRTILISNLPVIKPEQDNLANSFINLIDVLYDARVRLIISAEKPIEEIYTKGNLLFEFKRTKSRITEMQSEDYFYPGAKSEELTML